jgi:predicted nucleotidyltransferase
MRISDAHKNSMISVIEDFLGGQKGQLRLFGSRTRDQGRGGDIDLLLLVQSDDLLKELKHRKQEIIVRLKDRIGDQRIDLVIESSVNLEKAQTPFIESILDSSLLLKDWI